MMIDTILSGSCSRNRVGGVDCEIDHPELGVIPHTLDGPGVKRAELGQFGTIADYTAPTPTSEGERAWRDLELSKTDFTQLADVPVDSLRYATYRSALRDYPTTLDFLDGIRPTL